MNFQEFLADVKTHIQTSLGADATITVMQIAKNNGVLYEGLMITRKNCNISPTIFLDQYYQHYLAGMTLDEIYRDILCTYYARLPQKSFDADFFLDFDRVRPHIVPKLINFAKNSEQLQTIPHIRCLDLAVVFLCLISSSRDEQASVLIHREHMDCWDVDTDELYQLALRNAPLLLPYQFGSMMDFLQEEAPFRILEGEEESEIYLLTNQARIYGASALLYPGLLKLLGDYFERSLVIIPSSIHELLIVPVHPWECDPQSLSHFSMIVQEVNQEHVENEEVLSDHAYLYSREEEQLRSF